MIGVSEGFLQHASGNDVYREYLGSVGVVRLELADEVCDARETSFLKLVVRGTGSEASLVLGAVGYLYGWQLLLASHRVQVSGAWDLLAGRRSGCCD